MSHMKKKGLVLAVAGVLGLGSVVASAAPWVGTLDTTTAANTLIGGAPGEGIVGPTGGDGILQNVTNFDWAGSGAAWVQGFDLTAASPLFSTDTFTLTYQAFASAIGTSSSTPDLRVGAPSGPGTGTYEYTVYATFSELATVVGPSSIVISTLPGGSWTIYFDTSPDASASAGTGFTDGAPIVSGVFTGGLATYIATAPAPGGIGVGGGTLFGVATVGTVDPAYINPAMIGTQVDTSLTFPGNPAGYVHPAAFGGVATGTDTAQHFVLQADATQSFTVPEPGTLALMGGSLILLGAARRRNRS